MEEKMKREKNRNRVSNNNDDDESSTDTPPTEDTTLTGGTDTLETDTISTVSYTHNLKSIIATKLIYFLKKNIVKIKIL